MKARLLCALLAAVCASALAQPKSDWEMKNEDLLWSEEKASLPPYPKRENLVEFYVSATTDFRYFVDAASLSVGKDSVVRYAVIARSPSGAENVAFEGLRCSTGEYRTYAIGHKDGSWGGRAGDWRTYERATTRGWQYALARQYFCPHRETIRTAEEGIGALRNGSHPAVQVLEYRR